MYVKFHSKSHCTYEPEVSTKEPAGGVTAGGVTASGVTAGGVTSPPFINSH